MTTHRGLHYWTLAARSGRQRLSQERIAAMKEE